MKNLGNYHKDNISISAIKIPTKGPSIRHGWALQIISSQGPQSLLLEWSDVISLCKFLGEVIDLERAPKLNVVE